MPTVFEALLDGHLRELRQQVIHAHDESIGSQVLSNGGLGTGASITGTGGEHARGNKLRSKEDLEAEQVVMFEKLKQLPSPREPTTLLVGDDEIPGEQDHEFVYNDEEAWAQPTNTDDSNEERQISRDRSNVSNDSEELDTALQNWKFLTTELLRDWTGQRTRFLVDEGWTLQPEETHYHQLKLSRLSVAEVGDAEIDMTPQDLLSPKKRRMSRRVAETAVYFHWSLSARIMELMARMVIHPNSKRRMLWLLLAMCLCTYDFITVPIDVAFGAFSGETVVVVFQWMCLVYWTLDLGVSCSTGVYIDGVLHMKFSKILKEYAKTWLTFDICIVGVQWAPIFMVYTGSNATSNLTSVSFLRGLRLLRMLQLLRLARLMRLHSVFNELILDQWENMSVYFGLGKVCVVYGLGIHATACFWYWLRRLLAFQEDAADGFLEQEDLDVWSNYVSALHAAIGFLLGFENSATEGSVLQRAVGILLRFLGLVAMALFIATVFLNVKRLDQSKAAQLRRTCHGYLQSHTISPELSMRLRKYVRTCHLHSKYVSQLQAERDLISQLPRDLQLDLCNAANGTLVCNSPFFYTWQRLYPKVMRQFCCEAIAETPVKTRDVVFTTGYPATHMWILAIGKLQYRVRPGYGGSTGHGLLDLFKRVHNAQAGARFCEAALWTNWIHTGKLTSQAHSTLLALDVEKLKTITFSFQEAYGMATNYARKFVRYLNDSDVIRTDVTEFDIGMDDLDLWGEEMKSDDHFIFLSHFKEESGTEAVLLQEALTDNIRSNKHHPARDFKSPVFLDSENLVDLTKLQKSLACSYNLVVLLTPGVFTRPWCLVELCQSVRNKANLLPVEIQRPGMHFVYPNAAFYEKLRTGALLDDAGWSLLQAESVDKEELEEAIRAICKKIALPFSPHKSAGVRKAEMLNILERCSMEKNRNSATGSIVTRLSASERSM